MIEDVLILNARRWPKHLCLKTILSINVVKTVTSDSERFRDNKRKELQVLITLSEGINHKEDYDKVFQIEELKIQDDISKLFGCNLSELLVGFLASESYSATTTTAIAIVISKHLPFLEYRVDELPLMLQFNSGLESHSAMSFKLQLYLQIMHMGPPVSESTITSVMTDLE